GESSGAVSPQLHQKIWGLTAFTGTGSSDWKSSKHRLPPVLSSKNKVFSEICILGNPLERNLQKNDCAMLLIAGAVLADARKTDRSDSRNNQAERVISTTELNTLLRLYP